MDKKFKAEAKRQKRQERKLAPPTNTDAEPLQDEENPADDEATPDNSKNAELE